MRRPKLSHAIMTLCLLAVLVGLGLWQLERREWKTALLADLAARQSAAPVPLPLDVARPKSLFYRPFRLVGRYLPDRNLFLVARTYQGQPGLNVVSPFQLDDGRVVLVNRGWAPDEAALGGALPGEPTSVVAAAAPGGWGGMEWLRPDNNPAENRWLWLDLPAMAKAAKVGPQAVTALYFVRVPTVGQPEGYPRPVPVVPDLPNNHLQYALTWFALALALLAIFALFHRRGPAGPRA